MSERKETPGQERERLYREELKKNSSGNFNDNLNRTQSGMPNTTGMSTKEVGGLIVIIFVIFIVYSIYKLFQRGPNIISFIMEWEDFGGY